MEPITKYNSILAAIEYKNLYQDVINSLKESKLLKDGGFVVAPPNLDPSYGARMVRFFEGNISGNVQINQFRIQYEDANMLIGDTDKISNVMNELQEIRKKITDNENINWKGLILQTVYELEKDDLEKIKDKFITNDNKLEKGEMKVNFHDVDKLNYNISLIFDKGKLLVVFDINTRYVGNQDDWNIDSIKKKIKEYTEDPVKILKLI